jgi:glutamine synthetase
MTGMLDFDTLKTAVASGEIDTVLVCMVDMQGRLIGKRFHGEFFVNGGHEETHACDYLLADDIDMEPVPGYKAASWEKGYGDFVLKPDMSTLRRLPWLTGTALVLCDVQDHHHHDIAHSPRGILKKQLARLAERDMRAYFASELEFYLFDESYEAIRAKRYHAPKTAGDYNEDYHIFQTTKEEDVMRADAQRPRRARAFRSRIPRARRLGARRRSTSAMPMRSTWPTGTSSSRTACKEIAWSKGKAMTFLAKWRADLAGSRRACPCSRSGARTARPALLRQERSLTACPA